MKIVLFAILGAVCAVIIAGGLACMVTEKEPSPLLLSVGAAAGGALGSAVSYSIEGPMINDLTNFANSYTEIVPEMKVGMPMF